MFNFMKTLMLAALITVSATALARAAEQPHTWQLVIPNELIQIRPIDPAPRLTTLEGKTVVLRWNSTGNGNVFLDRLAELMAKRLPRTTVIKSYEKDTSLNDISGSGMRSQRMARTIQGMNPDLVIAAQCDSKACTSWLVADQSRLEKAGIPTITVATTDSVAQARDIQKNHGLTDMCFVTLPRSISMLPRQVVVDQTDAVFDDIVRAATDWSPAGPELAEKIEPYHTRSFTFVGTSAQLRKLFAKRGWSLSLPFVPPTTDKVAAMLKGTSRDPFEVVWMVPPRQGVLTVELVAALGVMAGAKPEHMPFLLSAVEAMKTPESVRHKAVADQPGAGAAAREGSLPTTALDYFAKLVNQVVGGATAPAPDKSAQGKSLGTSTL